MVFVSSDFVFLQLLAGKVGGSGHPAQLHVTVGSNGEQESASAATLTTTHVRDQLARFETARQNLVSLSRLCVHILIPLLGAWICMT